MRPPASETDLATFSTLGVTGAPQKGVAHRSRNVGQQRDIFFPARVSLWRVVTFESLLGAARRSLTWEDSVRRIVKPEIYDAVLPVQCTQRSPDPLAGF